MKNKNSSNHDQALISIIKNSPKKTPVKITLSGKIDKIDFGKSKVFRFNQTAIIFGDWQELEHIIKNHKNDIEELEIEQDRRLSAIPLLDLLSIEARIEPGAIIRNNVEIGKQAVIMMGAVINIGACIGEKTMIDMNVVIGGRAQIGKNCHIGAGAVIAGVIEPPSENSVVIEDNVLIGANAVVLEGINIKKGAIVAAGSVVTKDVEENMVVGGIPAKVLKKKDKFTEAKTAIIDALRELE